MTTKAIVIEWRNPRSKSEAECWGETLFENGIAKVFINLKKNRNSSEAVDTFFHEMAHVFLGFHTKNKAMSVQKEEYLATKVGNIVADLLR